jgi:pimeloyl-ACP methyl ester carboxylesterase
MSEDLAVETEEVSGVAAGVPFIAVPPAGGPSASSATIVAWHLFDAPRTEAAFRAAIPLAGLKAWRIYLGLPMSGRRAPAGGMQELMRLASEDAVLKLYGPVVFQAADEFGAAFNELQGRLELGSGPVGVLGGSIGAAVAQLVLVEGPLDVTAAVLVSPVVQLRTLIESMERLYGYAYEWSPRSEEVAARLDFVARAGDIAGRGEPAVLLIVGEDDDVEGFREPARKLLDALAGRYADLARVHLVTVPGMEHALAEEPGIEPAPQTRHAAEVDRLAVSWLQQHLGA